jgi:DNA-binding HxlR family transcriptional regulator
MPIVQLQDISRYRNCLPVLATLHREHGSKFVSLAHATGVSQVATRQALDHLMHIGLVMPNPGYGHPLRPEYILTPTGSRVGPACEAVCHWMDRRKLRNVLLRRWTLPIVHDVSKQVDARFGIIVTNLRPVTDRATAMGLRSLRQSGLIARRVEAGYPPQPVYTLSRTGEELSRLIGAMR